MPNDSTTRLMHFERCAGCGVVFPDTLMRIPRVTEAATLLSKYLDVLCSRKEANLEFLKKEYGEPVQKAIRALSGAVTCPECEFQANSSPPEARAAADALYKLMTKIEAFAIQPR